jgi:hypothetical protein
MPSAGSEIKIEMTQEQHISLTVTSISKTNPAVVTFADASKVSTGTPVRFAGTLEPTLDGKDIVLGAPDDPDTPVTYELIGVDGSGWTAAIATGTAETHPFGNACEAKDWAFDGGASDEIEKTTLCSSAKEFALGLSDSGNFNFNMNYVSTDPVEQELMRAKRDRLPRWVQVEYPDGSYTVFQAYCKTFNRTAAVGQMIMAAVAMRVTGDTIEVLPPDAAAGTLNVEGESTRGGEVIQRGEVPPHRRAPDRVAA